MIEEIHTRSTKPEANKRMELTEFRRAPSAARPIAELLNPLFDKVRA